MEERVLRPLARCLIVDELADLGEREAGVVAEGLDEPQPIDVGGVVEAVGALATGRGVEEPELLVVANRAGGQAELGGDFLDAQEPLRPGGRRAESIGRSGRFRWARDRHPPSMPNLT